MLIFEGIIVLFFNVQKVSLCCSLKCKDKKVSVCCSLKCKYKKVPLCCSKTFIR